MACFGMQPSNDEDTDAGCNGGVLVPQMGAELAVDVQAKGPNKTLLDQHAQEHVVQRKLLGCWAGDDSVPPRNGVRAHQATSAFDVCDSHICLG